MRAYSKISRAIKALEADKRKVTTPIVKRSFCTNLEDLATDKEKAIIASYDAKINHLRDMYLKVLSLEELMQEHSECNPTQVRCWHEINAISRAVRA